MKVRIQGTKDECLTFAEDMKHYYDVRYISGFYANTRKNNYSKEGRLYCEFNMTTYNPETGKTITI